MDFATEFPRRVNQETGEIRPTLFDKAPENIRGVMDEFFYELGGRPEGKALKAHEAAAREFVAEVGERPDLVKPAIEDNLKQGLGVASLRSLIATARVLKYKAKKHDLSTIDSATDTADDGHVLCPKCGRMVNPQTLNMACLGAHYVRVYGGGE